MDFDNVGLLCGFPRREVTRVLTALDVTLETIQEAQERKAELIVSHHPLIFQPLRRLLDDTPEERRVIALLKADLSAICLHTNLDIVQGGVNTALCAALGAQEVAALELGRVGLLARDMELSRFLTEVRQTLQAEGVRYLDAGRPVRQIAFCGGAGGDIVEAAYAAGCDTVLTGEIRHHQWLNGRERGAESGGGWAFRNGECSSSRAGRYDPPRVSDLEVYVSQSREPASVHPDS